MDLLVLLGVGLLTGTTTVLFGFGGGFVTVPVVVWADSALGGEATRVAVATSVVVMVVNAGFATAVTPRRTLAALRGGGPLLLLLAAGRRGRLPSRPASPRPSSPTGRSSPTPPSPSPTSSCGPASCAHADRPPRPCRPAPSRPSSAPPWARSPPSSVWAAAS